jgi:hypothetical protein
MDFHPMKNGLESTSLMKKDQKRKKFKSKPFNLFSICSKHNLKGNLNFESVFFKVQGPIE